MRGRVDHGIAGVARFLAARGVMPQSATCAALVVSTAAGAVLAAGGAAQEPRLWLLVPSLGIVRLVLYVVAARLGEPSALGVPSDSSPQEPPRP